ncbi:hypothetical protein SEVIR_1G332966v4 [Setaria viridis]
MTKIVKARQKKNRGRDGALRINDDIDRGKTWQRVQREKQSEFSGDTNQDTGAKAHQALGADGQPARCAPAPRNLGPSTTSLPVPLHQRIRLGRKGSGTPRTIGRGGRKQKRREVAVDERAARGLGERWADWAAYEGPWWWVFQVLINWAWHQVGAGLRIWKEDGWNLLLVQRPISSFHSIIFFNEITGFMILAFSPDKEERKPKS